MHAPQILQIQEKRCKDSTQYNQGETNLDTKKLSFTNAEQHKKKNSNHPNSIQDIHFNGGHHTAKLKHYSELTSPGIENQWGSQMTAIPWNNIHLKLVSYLR